jgi:hypothetical protein
MAADAWMKQAVSGVVKTANKDLKSIAAHMVKQNKKVFVKGLDHILSQASSDRIPGFLEDVMKTERVRAEQRHNKGGTTGSPSTKVSVPIVSRMIARCLRHPNADLGIPAITEIVEKLTHVKAEFITSMILITLHIETRLINLVNN